jgi:ribosomal protein S6
MPPAPLDNGRVQNFLRFTADEWRSLAMGQRALAYQAEKDAEGQSNPTVRARFLADAKRYNKLAEKCENAARVL